MPAISDIRQSEINQPTLATTVASEPKPISPPATTASEKAREKPRVVRVAAPAKASAEPSPKHEVPPATPLERAKRIDFGF